MSYGDGGAIVATEKSANLICGDYILRVNDSGIHYSTGGEDGPWSEFGGGGVAVFG